MNNSHNAIANKIEQIGGNELIWLGHSDEHGWVALDRSMDGNGPGNLRSELSFLKLSDWKEALVAKSDWSSGKGLSFYKKKEISENEETFILEKLDEWDIKKSERIKKQEERRAEIETKKKLLAQRQVEYRKYEESKAEIRRRSREVAIRVLRDKILKIQSEEKDSIKEFVSARRIEFLVHFTGLANLKSIILNGLIPRAGIEYMNIAYEFNDGERRDGLLEASSLSIDFPNYKMLYKYHNQSKRFGFLGFDPRILWELPCIFTARNAGAYHFDPASSIIEYHMGLQALEKMFEGNERIRSILPLNYTTDAQAEVLVLDVIPPKFIKSILLPVNDFNGRSEICDLASEGGIPILKPREYKWYSARFDDKL